MRLRWLHLRPPARSRAPFYCAPSPDALLLGEASAARSRKRYDTIRYVGPASGATAGAPWSIPLRSSAAPRRRVPPRPGFSRATPALAPRRGYNLPRRELSLQATAGSVFCFSKYSDSKFGLFGRGPLRRSGLFWVFRFGLHSDAISWVFPKIQGGLSSRGAQVLNFIRVH